LEIDFIEPASPAIKYLPFRFQFDTAQLKTWIVGHRTTIIDIQAYRAPSPQVFAILKNP
jgi:hypothetical protein